MKIACIGAGPAGLYFAISMKLRDPSHEIDVFERNPRGRDLRLGRRLLRPDGREHHGERPRVRARPSPTSSRIGTTSTSISAARRSRRPATASSASAASGCSKSCRTARASSACGLDFEAECDPADPKWRDYDLVIASDGINSRFRDAYADAFGVDVDVRANKFVWLGTTQGVRRLHLRVRGDRARLDLGARLSLRARLLDLHRRMFGRDLARASASTGWTRPKRSPRAKSCSPNISTAIALHVQRRASASARPPGSTSAASSASAGIAGNVILLGDAAHTAHFSVGSGTKLALEDAIKLAEVLNRPGLSARSRAGRICRRAEPRSAQASEQRAQLDRMVRDARALPAFRAAAIRLFAAHPQPAHQPRESAPARQGMAGRRRALVLEARHDGRSNKTAPPMFAPFKLREMEAREPHHRLADGDVFGGRRHAQRLPLRPSTASARWAAPASSSPR